MRQGWVAWREMSSQELFTEVEKLDRRYAEFKLKAAARKRKEGRYGLYPMVMKFIIEAKHNARMELQRRGEL